MSSFLPLLKTDNLSALGQIGQTTSYGKRSAPNRDFLDRLDETAQREESRNIGRPDPREHKPIDRSGNEKIDRKTPHDDQFANDARKDKPVVHVEKDQGDRLIGRPDPRNQDSVNIDDTTTDTLGEDVIAVDKIIVSTDEILEKVTPNINIDETSIDQNLMNTSDTSNDNDIALEPIATLDGGELFVNPELQTLNPNNNVTSDSETLEPVPVPLAQTADLELFTSEELVDLENLNEELDIPTPDIIAASTEVTQTSNLVDDKNMIIAENVMQKQNDGISKLMEPGFKNPQTQLSDKINHLSERLQNLGDLVAKNQNNATPNDQNFQFTMKKNMQSDPMPALFAKADGSHPTPPMLQASAGVLGAQDIMLSSMVQSTGLRAGTQFYNAIEGGSTISSSSTIDSLALNIAGAGKNPNGAQTAQAVQGPVKTLPMQSIQRMAVEIFHKANAGQNRFEIRLDPAELGRVDVKLEFQADNAVRAHLLVDRPETLELLQRDQRMLEKMMEEAGLELDQDALQFELKDQDKEAFDPENADNDTDEGIDADDLGSAIDAAILSRYQNIRGLNGVDVRI